MNLRLDWCSYEAAKYAVEHWHYSHAMPSGKLTRIGVWENNKFIGCVLFGRGATNHLVTQYGLTNVEGCELVRIALRNHKTPVSRIISIAVKMMKRQAPGLRLIVSFADTKENHHGGIYQAAGWIYAGETGQQPFPVINGKLVHPRTLSIMLRAGKFKKRSDVPHVLTPSKYRYLLPLDVKMKQEVLKLAKPYPKRRELESKASGFQPLEGGAVPTSTHQ